MFALSIALLSLVLFGLSLFSIHLMLYTWDHPLRMAKSSAPQFFLPPRLSFAVLLPARHEEGVIFETIKHVLAAHYPPDLLEVAVICHTEDSATIAEAQRAIRDSGASTVRLETFDDPPLNKPHGLNVGFGRTAHEVVTIFDAEDDIDPDVFNMVNTVMLEEGTGIVQAGVQLMNFRDHWFGLLNCLEYYFWFKSRLHFHAAVGMIPLGGNTVFIRRNLIEQVGGWDNRCLTEDADLGLRLSLLGESIRVVYDAQHVTREETPHGVGPFVRQRTRWNQGFLQVLRRGVWRRLPRMSQRMLAAYTLGYPLVQAIFMLVWPFVVVSLIWIRLPVVVVMVSLLPLYAMGFQFLVLVVGASRFGSEYHVRVPPQTLFTMAIGFLPFQWLLGASALRAVYRELRGNGAWEKTEHIGAHRGAPLHTSGAVLEAATLGRSVVQDWPRRPGRAHAIARLVIPTRRSWFRLGVVAVVLATMLGSRAVLQLTTGAVALIIAGISRRAVDTVRTGRRD